MRNQSDNFLGTPGIFVILLGVLLGYHTSVNASINLEFTNKMPLSIKKHFTKNDLMSAIKGCQDKYPKRFDPSISYKYEVKISIEKEKYLVCTFTDRNFKHQVSIKPGGSGFILDLSAYDAMFGHLYHGFIMEGYKRLSAENRELMYELITNIAIYIDFNLVKNSDRLTFQMSDFKLLEPLILKYKGNKYEIYPAYGNPFSWYPLGKIKNKLTNKKTEYYYVFKFLKTSPDDILRMRMEEEKRKQELEQRKKEENEKWVKWVEERKFAYELAKQLENDEKSTVDDKLLAWQDFIDSIQIDHPENVEIDDMLLKANKRVTYWNAEKKWLKWLNDKQREFETAKIKDLSREISIKEKILIWSDLLVSIQNNDTTHLDDDAMRDFAKSRIEHWQQSYIFFDDNSIIDTKNRLMWLVVQDTNEFTWNDADTYCKSLKYGNFNDWRLPTINELSEICHSEIVNKILELTDLSKSKYWTSTKKNTKKAFSYDLSKCKERICSVKKKKNFTVLPVRSADSIIGN